MNAIERSAMSDEQFGGLTLPHSDAKMPLRLTADRFARDDVNSGQSESLNLIPILKEDTP